MIRHGVSTATPSPYDEGRWSRFYENDKSDIFATTPRPFATTPRPFSSLIISSHILSSRIFSSHLFSYLIFLNSSLNSNGDVPPTISCPPLYAREPFSRKEAMSSVKSVGHEISLRLHSYEMLPRDRRNEIGATLSKRELLLLIERATSHDGSLALENSPLLSHD